MTLRLPPELKAGLRAIAEEDHRSVHQTVVRAIETYLALRETGEVKADPDTLRALTEARKAVWMELTGRCPLLCDHCYASSGPKGTDGMMLPEDWLRVIDDVAQLGGRMVQFIGGEPTLHRSLPVFVNHALAAGLEVEVVSNLVHVSPQLWEVFAQPGVRLATSYYSDRAAEHEAITKGRNSYARTKANIIEALRRSIPLRVGLINVQDGQRVEQARVELEALGVTDIGFDWLRQVGRGVRDQQASVEQLCGRCADGVVAVSPDGSVWHASSLGGLLSVTSASRHYPKFLTARFSTRLARSYSKVLSSVSADRTSRNVRRSPGATLPKVIASPTAHRATTAVRSATPSNAGQATTAPQTNKTCSFTASAATLWRDRPPYGQLIINI